jgi:hypothetical protein
MTAAMVSAAALADANAPIRLCVTSAIGRSATVASVTMPSVPSEPMTRPSRSGPSSLAPNVAVDPSGNTTSTDRM